jgi:hypothetical protein
VHVGLDGLAGHLGGRLEQRADVDVEAEVGEALAMTFWPRSWPSWPILATRIRGRRPSASAKARGRGADPLGCSAVSPASCRYTPLIVRMCPV